MATRRTGERITLSEIRETYFDGDFELCLKRCKAFHARDAQDAAEIVLLSARCLIQLGRGDQAIEALRGLRLADAQHDEYLIGRMLMSAAYVSLGRLDEGLKIGREAYEEIGDAHATVGSEVTLNLAIVYYRKGEYARTSRLLDAIPESEDIIYVRALQFRGGVAWATRFESSLGHFRDALVLLDACAATETDSLRRNSCTHSRTCAPNCHVSTFGAEVVKTGLTNLTGPSAVLQHAIISLRWLVHSLRKCSVIRMQR